MSNKKLDEFINDFNLVTTNTVTQDYFCMVNKKPVEIDYSNSIRLIDIVRLLNEIRLEYLEEVKSMPELNIGEEICFINYNDYSNAQYLHLLIKNPKKEIYGEDNKLYAWLSKDDEGYRIYLRDNNALKTMNDTKFSKEYNEKDKLVNKEIIDKYFAFFKKYNLFLKAYMKLSNSCLYGDGTTILFTNINEDNFVFSLGNNYFNTSDYIEILFKLDNNLTIKYEDSKVNLDSRDIGVDSETIDKLANNLYVDKDYLPELYKDKVKVKEKKI